MDFTIKTFYYLLESLKSRYPHFMTLENYVALADKDLSVCILRHDIDLNPANALKIAKLENKLNIKGSFYFRITPNSYRLDVMKEIEGLGHEIGYHYEDIDLVYKKMGKKAFVENNIFNENLLIDYGYKSFCNNLKQFEKYFKIKTICMHGSPMSKFDNRIIWDKFDYKKLGIIAEPYFDIDFSEFLYLTDTGRMWNGDKVSVRDKVNSNHLHNYKTSFDIINDIKSLPDKVMFTVHPQRWHNNGFLWCRELIFQQLKNIIKKSFFVKNR